MRSLAAICAMAAAVASGCFERVIRNGYTAENEDVEFQTIASTCDRHYPDPLRARVRVKGRGSKPSRVRWLRPYRPLPNCGSGFVPDQRDPVEVWAIWAVRDATGNRVWNHQRVPAPAPAEILVQPGEIASIVDVTWHPPNGYRTGIGSELDSAQLCVRAYGISSTAASYTPYRR